MANSKLYLEYGSGGSAVAAAKLNVDFVSVESDLQFLNTVEDKIRATGNYRPKGQTYHHADIGHTGAWGYPLGEVTAQRREMFRRYSDPPAHCFARGILPDLVLVDGRFRVACALKSLRMLQDQSGWSIVVDDYIERPQYHVIADFAELDRYVGRLAVFTAAKDVRPELLASAINSFEPIPA
jgi:hypothetical protein